MTLSVLLSIYQNEQPPHFDRALESLFDQSQKAEEVIIVKDGPISNKLESIISKWNSDLNIKCITLKENVGLGMALNKGLDHCTHNIVARMDTDDIAHKDRLAKQLSYLQENPDIDVVGSWISEFETDEQKIYAHRKLPENSDDINNFAKKRCPLNHMTVAFRKAKVLAAGGYDPSFRISQDYHLWVRMLMNGSRLANIPEYLVNVRAGSDLIERRGGWEYALNEIRLQREFLRLGFLNTWDFTSNVTLRVGVRIMPQFIRKFVYQLIRQINPN